MGPGGHTDEAAQDARDARVEGVELVEVDVGGAPADPGEASPELLLEGCEELRRDEAAELRAVVDVVEEGADEEAGPGDGVVGEGRGVRGAGKV